MKFRAYALIYALMVLVLIAVFSTVYLNLYYSNEHRLNMVFMQQDLRRDTKLALVDALNTGNTDDGIYPYNLSPLSQFTIKSSPWGLFKLMEIKGERQTFTEVYNVLTGYEIQTPEAPSLYFENTDVLKIGGSTLITRKAIVPRKGVERAYINSKGKSRTKLIDGKTVKLTRKSKKLLPKIEALTFTPRLESEINTANILTYTPGQDYFNSFSNALMLIEIGEHRGINSRLEGHIKLIGYDSVVVTKNAHLKHIQIMAPKIRIESNFKGEIQCFANQFIHLEQGVQLNYPSVLFLSTDSLNAGIILEKYSKVEGVILATKSKYERYLRPQVEFKKESKVVGQVITNRINTQLSGKIDGNVYLNTLFLKTKSSIYTNHLLDTEINIDQLPQNRHGVEVNGYTGQQKIMHWIDHNTL